MAKKKRQDADRCARPPRDKPWDSASDDKLRAEIVAALESTGGNIAHASEEMTISRRHLTNLLRDHDLVEFARGLRQQHWGRPSGLGRPPV